VTFLFPFPRAPAFRRDASGEGPAQGQRPTGRHIRRAFEFQDATTNSSLPPIKRGGERRAPGSPDRGLCHHGDRRNFPLHFSQPNPAAQGEGGGVGSPTTKNPSQRVAPHSDGHFHSDHSGVDRWVSR
jgi:hypothetical protein